MTLIKKQDGRIEEFDPQRVLKICKRIGVEEKLAKEVLKKVERTIKDYDDTNKIAKIIQESLPLKQSILYGLRDGVAALQPEKFELYVKEVLNAHGYLCIWNMIIPGKYVEHQVDIVATKGDEMFLVECKHHANSHRDCGLGEVLQVQARLEDIRDGYKEKINRNDFKKAWLITNTKFSEHAKRYAAGKEIILSGWRYKIGNSLNELIQKKKVFPVTVLGLTPQLISFCMQENILTIQQFRGNKELIGNKFNQKILNDAMSQIEELIS